MINKKAIIGMILVFTLALPLGCTVDKNQEDLNADKPANQEITKQPTISEDAKQENGIMDEFDSLVKNNAGLVEISRFINANIALLSKENASIIIVKFEDAQKQYFSKIEDKFYNSETVQSEMNKVYKPGFDIAKIDSIDNNELKDLLIETRDSGFKIETAEGMYFPIINYEFYKNYSSYVTSDMKDYINIMTIESNNVPAKDAALVIEWDEMLKRALTQEKFINQYSDSMKIDDINRLYKNYVSFVLFGLNNTPLFEYDSKVIREDAKIAYLNAIETNKDSNLVETLRVFFDVLEKNNYKLTDEVDNYRKSISDGVE